MIQPPRDSITVSEVVNATPRDVFETLTTNEGCRTFFARETVVRLDIGGPYEMLFDASKPEGLRGSEGCVVLSYLPDRMLSFSWSAPPQFAHARTKRTWVVVLLEGLGRDRTRVNLTNLGYGRMRAMQPEHAAEWDQVQAYFSRAWPFVLGNLKRRFEEGPRWHGWE